LPSKPVKAFYGSPPAGFPGLSYNQEKALN
jgi:hypothetical protein